MSYTPGPWKEFSKNLKPARSLSQIIDDPVSIW